MKVWYLPLETYRERYTEQLLNWTERAFQRHGVAYNVVHGARLEGAEHITTGPVLDARGRCHYALTQVAELMTLVPRMAQEDWVFVEDLFTPGYESLPYVFDQLGWRPRIATRNYAQSMDPDDFTFPMRRWMRHFEHLVDQTADVVFVASTVHREMIHAAGLDSTRTEVVGLPFDIDSVREQGPFNVLPWAERPRHVVYASRFDKEKQPHLFMDLVDRTKARDINAPVSFVVCTGSDEVRSNDPSVPERLIQMALDNKLTLHAGCTKADYYRELAQARVQFNCARQDFVSFTALEASAFGVATLAPAFRSFPEALEGRLSQLYVPWSVQHAWEQLCRLLDNGEPQCVRLAENHSHTFDRMIDIFKEDRHAA